jgi:hypothetical protein
MYAAQIVDQLEYSSHHPSSPPSTKALALLRSALSSPYPSTNPSAPPLQFDLDVVESSPPTPDQLKTIMSYVSSQTPSGSSLSSFLSSHPTSPSPPEQPQNASGIVELVRKNPNAFKWPVVVDWTSGKASVGDVEGVKAILENIRMRRDGETKEEEEHKPGGWFS